jgi:hypothetical protein
VSREQKGTFILIGAAVLMLSFQNCGGFNAVQSSSVVALAPVPGASPATVTTVASTGTNSTISCADLQQNLLALSAQGGGTYTVYLSQSITCTVQQLTYKGAVSPHGLLIPENVTLNLDGSSLLLDLESNSYGVRLTNNSSIQNGSVTVVQSLNYGSQGIWHSAISVGTAYGDGGSVANPSYFSNTSNWSIVNMTVSQPFPHETIGVMGGAYNGTINNVQIADSAQALIGIGFDWGTLDESATGGPTYTSADAQHANMRSFFEQGLIAAIYPHDIVIENVHMGHLSRLNLSTGDYSSGLRTAGCYNMKIENLVVDEAGVGVYITPGDDGFEFSLPPQRPYANKGYVINGVTISEAHVYGMIIDGLADNLYRAQINDGYSPIINPYSPGIDTPMISNISLTGTNQPGSVGIYAYAASAVSISAASITQFDAGLSVSSWITGFNMTTSGISHNLTYGMQIGSTTSAPNGVTVSGDTLIDNGISKANGIQIAVENATNIDILNNRIGEDSGAPDAPVGIEMQSSTVIGTTVNGNVFGTYSSGNSYLIVP